MNDLLIEIEHQLSDGLIQGCVCGTLTREPEAFGLQTVHPEKVPMSTDSRFDIASTGTYANQARVHLIDLLYQGD